MLRVTGNTDTTMKVLGNTGALRNINLKDSYLAPAEELGDPDS